MPNHSIRVKTYPLLQQRDLSCNAIARQLGCSIATVLRHARELHILDKERTTPRYDWVAIQSAYDKGWPPSRCMEYFGFSDTAWIRAIQTSKLIPDPARQRARSVALNESIVGNRYGHLVVIKQVESRKDHNRQWLCKCDCGNEKVWTTGALTEGSSQTCGCSRKRSGEQHANWSGHKEISGGYWTNIKNGATDRTLIFDLTIEQAWDLFIRQERKCAISGISLIMHKGGKRTAQTASLDRIDSTKGYVLDNVQWVHKDINYMKLDHTMSKFLNWIDIIYNHQHSSSHVQHTR